MPYSFTICQYNWLLLLCFFDKFWDDAYTQQDIHTSTGSNILLYRYQMSSLEKRDYWSLTNYSLLEHCVQQILNVLHTHWKSKNKRIWKIIRKDCTVHLNQITDMAAEQSRSAGSSRNLFQQICWKFFRYQSTSGLNLVDARQPAALFVQSFNTPPGHFYNTNKADLPQDGNSRN